MTVAVVIPCHNYGRYLGECLDSVLAQSIAPSEVVVVDDSSTDDTADVAEAYTGQGVRYLRVEHHHVHLARKAGFEATTADVLLFLDADNTIPPNYLEEGIACFTSSIEVVYADLEYFGAASGRTDFPAVSDLSHLERVNYIDACALVTREALTRSRAFEIPPGVNTHADWRLWLHVLEAGSSAVKQPLACRYRKHDSNMFDRFKDTPYYDRAGLSRADVTIVGPELVTALKTRFALVLDGPEDASGGDLERGLRLMEWDVGAVTLGEGRTLVRRGVLCFPPLEPRLCRAEAIRARIQERGLRWESLL